jgi:hypothetical protein
MDEVHCGKAVDSFGGIPGRRGRVSTPQERLDEAKIETLRTWGEGLRSDQRDEVRAAGRAITLLVEEIERLNIDLWHARTDPRESVPEGARVASTVRLPPPLPDYRTA